MRQPFPENVPNQIQIILCMWFYSFKLSFNSFPVSNIVNDNFYHIVVLAFFLGIIEDGNLVTAINDFISHQLIL